MQKVINTLAVFSFLGTAAIIGAGYYVYSQRDAILENVKEAAMEAVMGGIDLPTPELPVGGDAIPSAPVALPSSPF